MRFPTLTRALREYAHDITRRADAKTPSQPIRCQFTLKRDLLDVIVHLRVILPLHLASKCVRCANNNESSERIVLCHEPCQSYNQFDGHASNSCSHIFGNANERSWNEYYQGVQFNLIIIINNAACCSPNPVANVLASPSSCHWN